jgi:hypothetical protein
MKFVHPVSLACFPFGAHSLSFETPTAAEVGERYVCTVRACASFCLFIVGFFFLSPLVVLDIFLRRTDSEWYELREKIMFVVGWERGRGVWERLFLDSVKGMGVKKMVGELALKTFVAFLVLHALARVCNLKFWGCVCR